MLTSDGGSCHAVLHREAQPVRLPRPVVRVLAEQHHPGGLVRRQVQRGEDLIVWRENGVAGSLAGHEPLQLVPVRLVELGTQHWVPVGLHRLVI